MQQTTAIFIITSKFSLINLEEMGQGIMCVCVRVCVMKSLLESQDQSGFRELLRPMNWTPCLSCVPPLCLLLNPLPHSSPPCLCLLLTPLSSFAILYLLPPFPIFPFTFSICSSSTSPPLSPSLSFLHFLLSIIPSFPPSFTLPFS